MEVATGTGSWLLTASAAKLSMKRREPFKAASSNTSSNKAVPPKPPQTALLTRGPRVQTPEPFFFQPLGLQELWYWQFYCHIIIISSFSIGIVNLLLCSIYRLSCYSCVCVGKNIQRSQLQPPFQCLLGDLLECIPHRSGRPLWYISAFFIPIVLLSTLLYFV